MEKFTDKLNGWFNKEAGLTIIMTYVVMISVSIFGLILIGKIDTSDFSNSLLQWDANWYNSIVQNGYIYLDGSQSNAGFFPGFPAVWKFLGFGGLGISIFNLLLFLSSFLLLIKAMKVSNLQALFILSLPSIFFFYVPYSEALFYALSALAIVSWRSKKWWLVGISFFVLALIRPVVFFLFPAVFVLLLFQRSKRGLRRIAGLLVILMAGTFFGFYHIGKVTGDFFAYSNAQIQNWDHSFSIPGLPLTTWRGYRILWLDGLAFLTTLGVAVMAVNWIVKNIRGLFKTAVDELDVLSVVYTGMTLIYVLFFHGKEEGSTTILSMNRYVFCSPFLHYLMLKYLRSFEWNKQSKTMLISLLGTVLIVFGFPYHTVVGLSFNLSILFFMGVSLYFLAHSAMLFKKRFIWVNIILIIINLGLQAYVFQGFLKGNWIG